MAQEDGAFTPEEAMESADGPVVESTSTDAPPVSESPMRSIYAITRQVERDWGFSFDEPREDQIGRIWDPEEYHSRRQLPPDWQKRGTHVMDITYNFEDESVTYTRPDGTLIRRDSGQSTPEDGEIIEVEGVLVTPNTEGVVPRDVPAVESPPIIPYKE